MMKAEELDQLKVLVVDDEPLIRLFLVEELIDRGWQVYEAADGIEALVVIEHHPEIELVFSDLRMPGMNGIELLRIVHERWPSILLIISSGHIRLKNSELPDDARFLPKPINSNLMMKEIEDLVSLHGRGSS